MAAESYIKAITRICSAVAAHKELLTRLESLLYPVFLHSVKPEGIEYFEDTTDCAILLVYHQKSVSEEAWKVFDTYLEFTLGDTGCEEGGVLFDFIGLVQSYFANCIKHGKEAFLSTAVDGKTRFQSLMAAVPRIIEISRSFGEGMQEACIGLKMINTVLENCTGMIDDSVPEILGLITTEMGKSEETGKSYKSMLLQVLSMCFLYDSQLTFRVLEERGLTAQMLQTWFSSLMVFRRCFELRRALYGLSAIIRADPMQAPSCFSSELSQIMNSIAYLLERHTKAKERELAEDQSDEEVAFDPDEY